MRRDDLVIDVGMHTGEETGRFLAGGFDVVAVEANPSLVAAATQTFADAIDRGQLTIIGAAISDKRGNARFAISSNSIWSSLDPELIARNEREAHASHRYIDVETIPFEDILAQHGIPYYLKVDIEGYDMLCIRALRSFDDRPACLSMESHVSINRAAADAVFDEVAELWNLGYEKFRYVGQGRGEQHIPIDGMWRGPKWRSPSTALMIAQVLRTSHNLSGMGGRWSRTLPVRGYNFARHVVGRYANWYDLQATLL